MTNSIVHNALKGVPIQFYQPWEVRALLRYEVLGANAVEDFVAGRRYTLIGYMRRIALKRLPIRRRARKAFLAEIGGWGDLYA